MLETARDTLRSFPVPLPYLVLEGFISHMVLCIARRVSFCFFFQLVRNVLELLDGHILIAVSANNNTSTVPFPSVYIKLLHRENLPERRNKTSGDKGAKKVSFNGQDRKLELTPLYPRYSFKLTTIKKFLAKTAVQNRLNDI